MRSQVAKARTAIRAPRPDDSRSQSARRSRPDALLFPRLACRAAAVARDPAEQTPRTNRNRSPGTPPPGRSPDLAIRRNNQQPSGSGIGFENFDEPIVGGASAPIAHLYVRTADLRHAQAWAPTVKHDVNMFAATPRPLVQCIAEQAGANQRAGCIGGRAANRRLLPSTTTALRTPK